MAQIERTAGDKKDSSYIIRLKSGVDKSVHLTWLRERLSRNSEITHDYHSGFLNAFAGKFDEETLNFLRASPDVENISEDPIVQGFQTQNNAPWGLNRISQGPPLANQNPFDTNFIYTFNANPGYGVDIYVLDTGVLISHSEFLTRATWGYSAPGLPLRKNDIVTQAQDDNGHGTGVAGVACGAYCGVAKSSMLIAVKVLDFANIAGMDYVWNAARASGRPSIVNMSLGGPGNTSQDNAVLALTQAGIHVVAAGGIATVFQDLTIDAGGISPARSDYCTTVGATDIGDARWVDSNYGSVLDVFAPGVNIYTASKDNAAAMTWATGTSFAAPFVTGIIAYFISQLGNKTPADMIIFAIDNMRRARSTLLTSRILQRILAVQYTSSMYHPQRAAAHHRPCKPPIIRHPHTGHRKELRDKLERTRELRRGW
ncbi:Aqualysin-1 [Grifola frondosa]|uniref:Aqualysin-1 n=1 Tax=Grifola frondosa TaxID=5627 RepID=A0A1C7MCV4_GRIFR|nr:Aqualysin-1 [Grifola frondosa]